MTSGGSRNRSGPAADPTSGRSERAGYSLTALPAVGYDGAIPSWPLPERVVYSLRFEGSGKDRVAIREREDADTEIVADRELQLWVWAWRTPQAAAWSLPSESWRLHSIAMWVRTYVLCESSEATAADKGSLHRFADQIGLTPAGLKESGWQIKADDLAPKREEKTPTAKRERRLRVAAKS